MTRLKRTIWISILIMSVVVSFVDYAESQIGISFSWYLIKDDNIFKSRNEYSEMINTASLIISRGYSKNNFSFQPYYGIEISAFNENSDQKNNSHNFGIIGRHVSGDWVIDVMLGAQIRRNDAEFIYYNTNSFAFNIKTQYEPNLNTLYSIGLNYSKNEFTEFTEIDNLMYKFYGKIQRFFQSRISVSSEIGISVKNYVNQNIIQSFGSRSRGRISNPTGNSEKPLNALQFSADFNVGRSITDRTGMNIAFGGTQFVGDPIKSFSNGIYYFTENDLYDDPFSYEDKYISAYLTRQFGIGFQGKVGAAYHNKNYAGTDALDESGELLGENRLDTRYDYSFVLSKKFELDWQIPFSLSVYSRFLIRQDKSNDPYYTFTDHLGIFGLTISK